MSNLSQFFSFISGKGGSISSTGNTTLTSSSVGAQSITVTNYGQYVTLPDATTLPEGVNTFSIKANGDYPLGIKNNAGTQLGWIPPNEAVIVGLADNSTSAGVWVIPNISKLAVTAQMINEGGNIGSAEFPTPIELDANRTLFIYNPNNPLYGVVYDKSTLTWGALTSIRAEAVRYVVAIKSATDQVIVVSCNSTSTALQAVALTISGTAITVNTAASATLAGNIGNTGMEIVACGSSWVFGYTRDTSVAGIRGLTISGTTITIGAETALAGTGAGGVHLYPVSSSVILTLSGTSTLLTAQPCTVSGTTLTLGTAATMTSISTFRSGTLTSGRWYVQTVNTASASLLGGIISVSGTVATISSATIVSGQGAANDIDVVEISANKLLFVGLYATPSTLFANTLTDTAGVASVGAAATKTVLTMDPYLNWLGFGICMVSGTDAYYFGGNNGSSFALVKINASVATPVITFASKVDVAVNAGGMGANPLSGGRNRIGTLVTAGTNWFGLGISATTQYRAYGNTKEFKFYTDFIRPSCFPPTFGDADSNGGATVRLTPNKAFGISEYGGGMHILHIVECAA